MSGTSHANPTIARDPDSIVATNLTDREGPLLCIAEKLLHGLVTLVLKVYPKAADLFLYLDDAGIGTLSGHLVER